MKLGKTTISLLGASLILFGAVAAHAGAYGEPEDPTDAPTPPPPAPPVPEPKAEPDYTAAGPYLAAGGLVAFDSFTVGPQVTDENSSWGETVRGGYRFNKTWAAEAVWENYNEFDYDPAGHFEGWSLSGNVKAIYGEGDVQFFGVGGLGYMSGEELLPAATSSSDDSAFMIRFGAGGTAYVTENLFTTLEAAYSIPFGDLEDRDFVGLSWVLGWHFH